MTIQSMRSPKKAISEQLFTAAVAGVTSAASGLAVEAIKKVASARWAFRTLFVVLLFKIYGSIFFIEYRCLFAFVAAPDVRVPCRFGL